MSRAKRQDVIDRALGVGAKTCKICRECANYGFGCPNPLTVEEDKEAQEFNDYYLMGRTRPDCFERE